MRNNFFYQKSLANIYAKPSVNSEVTSQILFGEKFKVLKKKKSWLKIKTNFDNYTGYIKNDNFFNKFKPSHKIYKLNSKIFKRVKNKFLPSKKFLYFGSKISVISVDQKFVQFKKNQWIKKSDLKDINYIEKDFFKILKLFLNMKYLWGGKTSKGIDCSALIQIFFFFNNIYFPRDTKDQIKFLRRIKSHKFYKKDKLLYWKGHVAVRLDNKFLIHAYGPKKKVIIMKIIDTVKEIKKNANLDLQLI